MDGPGIRRLDPSDAGAWMEMRLRALEESPDAFVTTLAEARARTDSLATVAANFGDPSEITLGAVSQGRVVASATLGRAGRAKVRHVGHLQGMYVMPEARRHGLGRRLVTELLQQAREMGLKQVKLEVVSDQEPAIRLYEACGFRSYGREKRALVDDGRCWDMVLMVCFLDDLPGGPIDERA